MIEDSGGPSMPRWDEDEDRDEDEPDFGQDDDEPLVPCPHCRRELPEDVARCPYCGNYLSRDDAPRARKPWWIIVGFLACFYVVYRWIFWLW